MEPVPETERMEEFRSSPLPSLRITNPYSSAKIGLDIDTNRKPPTPRRSTDPSPTSTSPHTYSSLSSIPYRPRTASPLSAGHIRSQSTASLAPPMSRTQSMPGLNGSGHLLYTPLMRSGSPSGSQSPSRVRPLKKHVEEAFPSSSARTSVLDNERGPPSVRSSSPGLAALTSATTRLRRASSPLRSVPPSSNPLATIPSTPSSISPSPSYRAYDSFYSGYGGSLSSIPSTPTSVRSRSPSISSLETIPDSPDAEEAALEADRVAQTAAEADGVDGSETLDSKGRNNTLDTFVRGRTMSSGSSRDKRKRWSVCGAERRGDLDLETIWED